MNRNLWPKMLFDQYHAALARAGIEFDLVAFFCSDEGLSGEAISQRVTLCQDHWLHLSVERQPTLIVRKNQIPIAYGNSAGLVTPVHLQLPSRRIRKSSYRNGVGTRLPCAR